MTHISGENLSKLCDMVYVGMRKGPNGGSEYYSDIEGDNTLEGLKDNDTVFIKTEFIQGFCNSLGRSVSPSDVRVNIITHDSDMSISEELFNQVMNDGIKSWYGINIEHKDPRLFSIPIGLANEYCPLALKIGEITPSDKGVDKNLLYVNHRINTYPRDRIEPYTIFEGKDWSTVVQPSNDKKAYIEGVKSHKFVLCPRGNGVDTHRMWETLYLGSIPIIKRSINASFYEDLPILVIDEYSDINKEMLESNYEDITSKEYDESMMTSEWWLDKIKGGSE
jgi:hypothetical protein